MYEITSRDSIGVVLVVNSPAATRYVNVNSTNPTPPYNNWATAATVIQDAVDVAVAGDEVLVANGVYATGGRAVFGTMTNRVAVDKPITVRSVNGPVATLIKGYQVPGTVLGDNAIRCVYLTNGASISGFTLTNGATQTVQILLSNPAVMGGGIWCEAGAVVSNCVVTGNVAFLGGEARMEGRSTTARSQAIESRKLLAEGAVEYSVAPCIVARCQATPPSWTEVVQVRVL